MPHRLAIRTLFLLLLAMPACKPPDKPLSSGIDQTGMDKSFSPGDNFYRYANGGWIKATQIPPDKSTYGTFAILADQTRTRVPFGRLTGDA